MRVLINAFSARQGGGQTYLINLLRFMPENIDAEIFIFAPDSLALPANRANVTRLSAAWPVENPYLRALWEKFQLPGVLREMKADILFCPGGVVATRPPRGCKTVTMFRNMIPFDLVQRRKYPLGRKRLRNWLLHRVLLESMVQADLVIFISEYARKVIEGIAGKTLHAAVVIPHGVNPRFRIEGNKGLARPAWLPDEGYLLYVSTLDVYKAQLEVVQGFAILKQRQQIREKLILAGPENPEYGRRVRSEIKHLGLSNEVIVTGAISHEDLPAVYQHATINLFASESENCPNILLEALAAGRPVVSSDYPPMPEFGGEAALYFDPKSPTDLAQKLSSVMENPDLIQSLSLKAAERSRIYDWGATARQTWHALELLHRRGSQPT